MFDIRFTQRATEDLQVFSRSEQKWILGQLEQQLAWNAADESKDRRRLRPCELAEWAVRLGAVRVFYDVDVANQTVKIEAVGKKMTLL